MPKKGTGRSLLLSNRQTETIQRTSTSTTDANSHTTFGETIAVEGLTLSENIFFKKMSAQHVEHENNREIKNLSAPIVIEQQLKTELLLDKCIEYNELGVANNYIDVIANEIEVTSEEFCPIQQIENNQTNELMWEEEDAHSIPPFDDETQKEGLHGTELITPEVSCTTSETNVIQLETRPQYVCAVCGKHFVVFRHYNLHLRKHNINSLYKCEICENVAFLRFGALQRHILKMHISVSQENSPHCVICDKYFRSKYALKIHMRFHTGILPYVCATCGKRFSDNGHLQQHIRVKHEQFRFKCDRPECGRIFESDRSLRNHVYGHDNSWPYVCAHCGKGIGTKYDCRTHIIKKHKFHPNDDVLNAMQMYKRQKMSQSHCLQRVSHEVLPPRGGT